MRVHLAVAAVLPIAVSLFAILGYAEDWSRFRGPNGSGVSKATGFPTQFSRDSNVIWRTPARSGKSSPILTRTHVFLTAFEDGKLFTQCFDRKSGRLLWERAEARPREEGGNLLNQPAAITPVTDGENVYVFFPDLGLISYDSAGNLRWKTLLGPFTNTMGLAASPILAEDSIIVVADQQEESFIAAFDRRTGKIRWKTAREEKDGWATPVIFHPAGADSQILTASRGYLGAHRVKNGARSLTHSRLSPAIVASPVLEHNTLFTFGYGHESATPFSNILARYDKNQDGKLSPDEYGTNALIIGIGRWEGNRDRIVTKEEWDEKQRQVVAPSSLLAIRLEGNPGSASRDSIHPREIWRFERNFVGVIPSPLVYDGVLYLLRNGGILATFDAQTGEVLRTERVQGALGAYSASPVAGDGKIYLASEEGKIAVLRSGRGWTVLAVNELGEGCFATPALSEGNIYLRTGAALYRFGSAEPH